MLHVLIAVLFVGSGVTAGSVSSTTQLLQPMVRTFSSFTFTYPLNAWVAGAPQMPSRSVLSIFPSSPLPSGTWRTPGLPIPRCCLPASFSVCLVCFPFSLCLARWFRPDLINLTARQPLRIISGLKDEPESSRDSKDELKRTRCVLCL